MPVPCECKDPPALAESITGRPHLEWKAVLPRTIASGPEFLVAGTEQYIIHFDMARVLQYQQMIIGKWGANVFNEDSQIAVCQLPLRVRSSRVLCHASLGS